MKKLLAGVCLIVLLLAGAAYPQDKAAGHESLTVTAVGDIMLARKVGQLIDRANDVNYPFAEITPWINRAAITFGNLESPFGTGGRPIPGKGIWFRANPDCAGGLKGAGFDVLSLANNHILDFDSEVLNQTLGVLDNADLGRVGAGRNIYEARSPLIIEKNGTKAAFLAYSEFYNIYWDRSYPRSFLAKHDLPGVAPLDFDVVAEDIARVRNSVDLVVVSLHWGSEESPRPSAGQRELVRRLWEAGADVVLGHHPHVLQGLEVQGGKVAAYSLGNFVFDQPWEENRQSAVLNLSFDGGKLAGLQLVPVYITQGRPEVAEGDRARVILEKMAKLSAELGTRLCIRKGAAHVPDLAPQPAALTLGG